MAAKWADIETYADEYDLQYRTAGDSHVRESHAILDGTTLPVTDPFWDIAYPPNGWRCRCTAIRVAKGSIPYDNSKIVTDTFKALTERKDEIFRFNPGKQQVIFPPHHPYYGKRGIDHCNNPKLAANTDKNEECDVLRNIIAPENLTLEKEIKELMEKEKKSEKAATRKAYSKTLKNDFYPARVAKELLLSTGELKEINISFRGKGIDHLINDVLAGKCPSLSIDNLLYLDEHIAGAKQISRRLGELSKTRKDAIEHFYYLDANINGSTIVIILAQEYTQGKVRVYPYSIYEKKKS